MALIPACHISPETPSRNLPQSMLRYSVSYSENSPLPGNEPADSNSLRLEDSLGMNVSFLPMTEYPENSLDPVESHAQRITVHPTSSAVTAVAGLLRKAKVGVVQSQTQILEPAAVRDPSARLSRETLQGVLPEGVGVSFNIHERPVVDAGTIRKLEIHIRREPGREPEKKEVSPTGISLNVSLVATGELKETALPDAGSPVLTGKDQLPSTRTASDMLTTETILLTPQNLRGQDRLAIILPSPFGIEGIAAFVALIEVKSPPQRGTAEEVAFSALLKKCQEDLRAAAERDAKQGGPQFDAGRRGIEDAIRLVLWPTHRRQSLLYLARAAEAPVIEDITLSGTDIVMDRLAHAIRDECELGPCFEANSLGWRLQQIAYQLLAEGMSADQMRPELEAIVIRYTGEVGRHPSVLKEMVSDATGVADLEKRLLQENFIYLEDISPAARTRAFEWLAARGQAPKGYDPLAPIKERRSALNQFQQEQQ